MILLREIDGSYRTPASENLVYQSLPAIVFGFPLMFLAPYAATSDLAALITCAIAGAAFIVLNIVLFRRSIFRKHFVRNKAATDGAETNEDINSPDEEISDGAEDSGASNDENIK